MRHKTHIVIRTLVLATLLLATSVQAAGLRLVTGTDYPPYAGPDLAGGGMATALVVAAFEAAGVAVEPVEYLPWKRGYQAVLDGEFDATFPYVAAPGRDQAMSFSTPIYEMVIYPVFRADRTHPYAGPDSLAGLTLCQPVGYAQPAMLQHMVDAGTLQLVQPATMALCARQLLAGRVDLLINSPALFQTIVRPEWHDGPALVMGDHPVERNPLHLLAARANPQAAALLAGFATGLAALHADGRYDAIVQRYLGEAPAIR